MPELPEVETIRRELAPLVSGRTITLVAVPDPLIISPVKLKEFQKGLQGQVIVALKRRGKYMLAALESGSTLVLHLRMTGRLTHFSQPAGIDPRHLRLTITLDDGGVVAFHDQRRFGRAFILSAADAAAYWQRLGPEPLERSFNHAALKKILNNRKRPMKSLLLDQQLIAGIGNIYADESLYAAGIHPLRTAASVSDEESARLVKAIKDTLRRAIRLEGSSIDTYRTASGGRGRFQETFRVHRRAGEPCACGGTVEKIKVGGRGTYFCPRCQPEPQHD